MREALPPSTGGFQGHLSQLEEEDGYGDALMKVYMVQGCDWYLLHPCSLGKVQS